MKFLTLKNLFQYFLPTTLTVFMLITIKRMVVTDGGYDRLFGLPLPFISNNYGFSFHFDIYILAMLFDLLFYLVFSIIVFKTTESLGLKLKTHWTFIAAGTFICLFWIVFFVLKTQGSSFKLANDIEFRTAKRELYFGSFP